VVPVLGTLSRTVRSEATSMAAGAAAALAAAALAAAAPAPATAGNERVSASVYTSSIFVF
jgi:hypothetical protein